MTITTKFNVGEMVFFIENNEITSCRVSEITYESKRVYYRFITSRAPTTLDRDTVVEKEEKDCFVSIDEMAKHYKEKNSVTSTNQTKQQ